MDRNLDYNKVLIDIRSKVLDYLTEYKIQALILGVSGGLDSGVNAAMLSPICKELGIPLIGRYIHIETNKKEEKLRADMIGKLFCTYYDSIDLTQLYFSSLPFIEEGQLCDMTLMSEKIRRGNIKARLRMIHLYNMAAKNNGIVVDNDNLTEFLLGFYTIGGDIGDITPMADLYKTEVFKLAKHLKDIAKSDEEKESLSLVIDAVPCDGLGISSSDMEQFSVDSYDIVDDILFNKDNINELIEQYGEDATYKILSRHKNSNFKRNHPFRIKLDL